jgi:integrase
MTGGKREKVQTMSKQAGSSGTETQRSSDTSMSEVSKHPAEEGLRERRGKWEYRFRLNGKQYSQVTDLAAVPENLVKAQVLKQAHFDLLKSGKRPVLRPSFSSVGEAIEKFMTWYKSEHPLGGDCKWAASLLASFEYYLDHNRIKLAEVQPSDLENFKQWRRDTHVHENTLHKQLLLINKLFVFSRRNGWLSYDPFAKGEDIEVKVPPERDSTVMHVLSLDEERLYLAAAKEQCLDLFDVATIMKEQGPRPDELLSLEQKNVDLFKREFTIWDHTDEGKSRNAHRILRMTEESLRVFARRLSIPGRWVFPSSKLPNEPRTTLQKAHERITRGRKIGLDEYEGGTGVKCRIYDFRHTFATRFALAGGNLPVLSRILGHADLAMLNKYVHPSQDDMNRAMDWFSKTKVKSGMLSTFVEDEAGSAPEVQTRANSPIH